MKTAIVLTAAAVVALFSAPASAWEGKKVACYDKHYVPAAYSTSKKLKHAARTEWEHRDGQIVEVYYAPVYIEKKHLAKEAHYVLRRAACN